VVGAGSGVEQNEEWDERVGMGDIEYDGPFYGAWAREGDEEDVLLEG
jgi:hypothetical protein